MDVLTVCELLRDALRKAKGVKADRASLVGAHKDLFAGFAAAPHSDQAIVPKPPTPV